MTIQPDGATVPTRPWWACALVAAYLGVAFLCAVGLLAIVQPGLAFGAYVFLLIPLLAWFVLGAVVAGIVLVVTRRSPWARPEVDALSATAAGLAVSLVVGVLFLLATATRV